MPSGYSTFGQVSEHRGHGKVHLAIESDTGVAKGFSGAAVWSADYQAVIGIVLEANSGKGDAQALTFRRPLKTSPYLENMVNTFRQHVPFIEDDRILHDDMHKAEKFLKAVALPE